MCEFHDEKTVSRRQALAGGVALAAATTGASVASAHYGKSVGIPAYGLAVLVGLSRLRKNAHWLSDVVAGAGLGQIVGSAAVRQNGAPLTIKTAAFGELSITPSLDPSFRGLFIGKVF